MKKNGGRATRNLRLKALGEEMNNLGLTSAVRVAGGYEMIFEQRKKVNLGNQVDSVVVPEEPNMEEQEIPYSSEALSEEEVVTEN